MTAPTLTDLPLLVTMGDAAGIGPEIIARRRSAASCTTPWCSATWPCCAGLRPCAAASGRSPCSMPRWMRRRRARCACAQVGGLPAGLDALPWGRVDARAGAAAARCIEAAVAAVRAGQGRAIVTAPIHKEALAAAGVPYPGHTEMLQALAAAPGGALPPVRMMLANPELRVVLATIHVALRDAIAALDFDTVLSTIRIAQAAAQRWGLAAPRIAVAGLNPHAGEGGLFGDEEIRFIAPAVQAARAEGIDASGPYPPDTVFMRARRGAFDLVVAMTHDHGLIAVKYLGVEDGVNVTLGLPFVRTSPDHGTAFDIAGQGGADPASLLAALRMARTLAAVP
jgi:4-hydroxythreonine-4-phosphate dehydrogenase